MNVVREHYASNEGQGQRQVPNLNLAIPFLIVGQVQVRLGLRHYLSCPRLGQVQVYAFFCLKKPGGPGFRSMRPGWSL